MEDTGEAGKVDVEGVGEVEVGVEGMGEVEGVQEWVLEWSWRGEAQPSPPPAHTIGVQSVSDGYHSNGGSNLEVEQRGAFGRLWRIASRHADKGEHEQKANIASGYHSSALNSYSYPYPLSPTPYHTSITDGTIVLLLVTSGYIDLLRNFLCAAFSSRVGEESGHFLILTFDGPADQAVVDVAEELGVGCYTSASASPHRYTAATTNGSESRHTSHFENFGSLAYQRLVLFRTQCAMDLLTMGKTFLSYGCAIIVL